MGVAENRSGRACKQMDHRITAVHTKNRIGLFAGEDYEMVGYGFVRYTTAGKTSGGLDAVMSRHLEFIKSVVPKDSLIAEGVFANGEGAILVMRGEPDEQILKEEPAVVSGEIGIATKKLWIARGAFCEH